MHSFIHQTCVVGSCPGLSVTLSTEYMKMSVAIRPDKWAVLWRAKEVSSQRSHIVISATRENTLKCCFPEATAPEPLYL